MRRLFFSLAITSLAYAPAYAHDFWLGPKTYQINNSSTIPVSVMIGHPKDKSRWTLDPHRIISLKSMSTSGLTDHQNRLETLTPNGDMPLRFEGNGTHILMIETTSASSILPADSFNAYLKEEGLTPIKLDRENKQLETADGREIYSRRGKALIQIGPLNEAASSNYVTQPLGLTLEIVPQTNPYAINAGEPLTSTIYYRGKPTQGVTIGLISLDTELGLIDIQKTNSKGEVTFKRPETGEWMLHAVWSDPLEDTRMADYDTIFSSLSFGFD